MTKSTARRSALDRQRSLLKAWQPGVTPLRELVAGGYMPASVKRAFTGLKLDPNTENDWKVLAALLADHLFDSGKSPGARPWTEMQQIQLLAEVHRRKQDSAAPLNDEQVCRLIARDKKSPPHFRRSPRTVESKGSGLVKQLRKARQQFAAIALAHAAYPLAFITGRY
jgi:hypothetical protein